MGRGGALPRRPHLERPALAAAAAAGAPHQRAPGALLPRLGPGLWPAERQQEQLSSSAAGARPQRRGHGRLARPAAGDAGPSGGPPRPARPAPGGRGSQAPPGAPGPPGRALAPPHRDPGRQPAAAGSAASKAKELRARDFRAKHLGTAGFGKAQSWAAAWGRAAPELSRPAEPRWPPGRLSPGPAEAGAPQRQQSSGPTGPALAPAGAHQPAATARLRTEPGLARPQASPGRLPPAGRSAEGPWHGGPARTEAGLGPGEQPPAWFGANQVQLGPPAPEAGEPAGSRPPGHRHPARAAGGQWPAGPRRPKPERRSQPLSLGAADAASGGASDGATHSEGKDPRSPANPQARAGPRDGPSRRRPPGPGRNLGRHARSKPGPASAGQG